MKKILVLSLAFGALQSVHARACDLDGLAYSQYVAHAAFAEFVKVAPKDAYVDLILINKKGGIDIRATTADGSRLRNVFLVTIANDCSTTVSSVKVESPLRGDQNNP